MSDARAAADRPRISVSTSSTRENRTGSWKYIRPRYRDGVAPCNARCPTGVDVEGYMNLLREGRTGEAVDLLLRENPMPAITGRVCHHPCESVCNRAQFDDAVAVHRVERALGDQVLSSAPPSFARTRAETIAVIGSGPAGLACAYHLARLGYGVTVFEEAAEAGGMLRQGIPSYRVPRDVLDRQIDWLEQAGIEIRCDTRVEGEAGRQLLEEYDAVFIGTGAHRGRPLGVPGEDGPGVMAGLQFLKAVNRGERPPIGRRVVVVGGGNTAMDCARTALRLGATPIVVYRRTRAEMPAIAAEVEEARHEGIVMEFLASPRAFHHADGAHVHADGGPVQAHRRLVAVECERMALGEPDASGRRRPVPTGETFTIPADTVLTAIGEESELDVLPGGISMRNGGVAIDELGRAGAGFFAGGDLAGVERTVSDALGSGKVAALGIDRTLRSHAGEPVAAMESISMLRWSGGNVSMSRWRQDDPVSRTAAENIVVGFDALNTAHFARVPRQAPGTAGGPRRPTGNGASDLVAGFSEATLGLTPLEALAEARRCFNCGVCNECELCLIFCPDAAITRLPQGKGFDIDLNYCKGCGVCAMECPRGAIVMTREAL